ncbi:hypothetical protein BB560_002711 [Smittium megazygosporum]|uniref:mRNA-capping enzyme subunit beta n=1 Tax=Smittium megazygosporum TaxID=133381 RepID=A0A2T9ZE24_9FUNG|nr:hypothetical protein BB560_002711 [Smittium megazygosporum]
MEEISNKRKIIETPEMNENEDDMKRIKQIYRPMSPISSRRLENSIFGYKPTDDLFRTISDFIFRHCHLPDLEIEAKLGIIIHKNEGKRLRLPIETEAALMDKYPYTFFQSEMSELFNARFSETNQPGFKGSKINYTHTNEVDEYYKYNNTRLRVTFDKKTNKRLFSLSKQKIKSLDIYSPKTNLDFRISVNQENKIEAPENLNLLFKREKDRISYRQDLFSFDLTKVESENVNQPAHNPKTTYELEIEIADIPTLAEEAKKAKKQLPNRFNEIVQCFINNIRVLAKSGLIERPH